MKRRPSAIRRTVLLTLCCSVVVAIVFYCWSLSRFNRHWATIQKGDTWADVRSLLGKPDRDTKMADLFAKDRPVLLREWYNGPWHYVLYLDMNDDLKPATVYTMERGRRNWREYLPAGVWK